MPLDDVHELPRTGVEILAGRRGHRTARVTGEDGSQVYLHSLYDPIREADEYVPENTQQKTVVFLGAGLGYHIGLFLNRNPQINRVVIIEFYYELIREAAAQIDTAAIRVDFVTSAGSGHASPPLIPADLDAANLLIVPHTPSLSANPTWYARYRTMLGIAGSKTSPKDVATGGKRPLTVLFLFGSYYCQAESIRGFEALGHRVIILDYRGRENTLIDRFNEILRNDRPDLVFSINMRGLDNRGVMAGILSGVGIPLVLWFVDSPEFILYGEALPSLANCRVFVWEKSYLPMVQGLGYDARYLPLAADPALIEAAVVSSKFKAEISFVGNSLCSGFLNRLSVKFPKSPATMQLAESSIAALQQSRGDQLALLGKILDSEGGHLPGKDEQLFFRAYVLHSATTLYRTTLLEKLLPLPLTFFGDPEGWSKVFGNGINTRPDVNYFHETPSVYASSAINFNATSFQMPSTVNQRVFDVPLCGGFLLTDRQEDLHELFADDEVATFESSEDVAEKAKYYLANPAIRAAIAAKARRRILDEHTYKHRMASMLEQVF
jgi:spore maturation protein CgeB